MPIRPTPTPPGEISPNFMCTIGADPAERRERVVHAVDGAGRGAGGRGGEQAARGGAEAHLLALHVPARLRRRDRLVDAERGQLRVAVLLGEHRQRRESRRGCPPSRRAAPGPGACPSTRLPNVTTKANGISRSVKISRKLVNAVRVLERVRRVGVVEAAAVGAELLDRLLRRERPPGMCCVGDLGRRGRSWSRGVAALEVLDDALRHRARRRTRAHSGSRMRMIVRVRSTQKLPRVRGAASGDAADERHDDRHAGRRRHEVLHREADHLREVAHRQLAREPLPVGVGHEADRDVERTQRRHRAVVRRVERQRALQAQHQVQDEERQHAEREQRRAA